jgi:hypothetical protein
MRYVAAVVMTLSISVTEEGGGNYAFSFCN